MALINSSVKKIIYSLSFACALSAPSANVAHAQIGCKPIGIFPTGGGFKVIYPPTCQLPG
ncbi:MAG TPA: hypothetical protein VIC26_01120 [Marinagarivorans sp.]